MCAVVLDLFNIVEYYKSRFICIILLLCSFRKLSGARVNSWFLDHIMTLKCNERCVSASNLLNLIWPPNSRKIFFWKLKKKKKDYRKRRVGIGTGMRAISINGVPPFLSIARNLLLSEALFQLLRAIIGGRCVISYYCGNNSAPFIGKNVPGSYLHRNTLKSTKKLKFQ